MRIFLFKQLHLFSRAKNEVRAIQNHKWSHEGRRDVAAYDSLEPHHPSYALKHLPSYTSLVVNREGHASCTPSPKTALQCGSPGSVATLESTFSHFTSRHMLHAPQALKQPCSVAALLAVTTTRATTSN